mgnify:CR=1 FL=1
MKNKYDAVELSEKKVNDVVDYDTVIGNISDNEVSNEEVINETDVSIDVSDIIEEKDAKFEFIMLGLRTTDGISVEKFNAVFSADFDKEYKDVLAKKARFLERDGNILKIKDVRLVHPLFFCFYFLIF